jgi:hypothetical protein
MKKLLLSFVCTLALAACQTASVNKGDAAKDPNAIEITGGVSTSMVDTPIVPEDPNVTVYPLDGPVQNPMSVNRTHSVLDNTTAGGYTVFDDSVTVYPLPGDDTPAFMPKYAVPPLKGQYVPQPPMVGKPMGLASAGALPPVPNYDVDEADPHANPPVSGAVRKPLMLTAPEPVTMQPVAGARPPLVSPFEKKMLETAPKPQPLAPLAEAAPAPVASAPKEGLAAGRRSGPMLTDY